MMHPRRHSGHSFFRLLRTASAAIAIQAVLAAHAQTIEERLASVDLGAGSIGVSITRLDGTPVVSHHAHQRFLPASSQKLLTTVAAFHFLGDFQNAGWPRGTRVEIEQSASDTLPSIRLIGSGDATLSAKEDCRTNCLSQLADAVIQAGYAQLADVWVDDTLFRAAHRPAGWSHDDLKFAYGAAISALATDDGTASARIFAPAPGAAPQLIWTDNPAFQIDMSGVTTNSGAFELEFEQQAGTPRATLYGNLPPRRDINLNFGLNDPAIYAGQQFRQMLVDRGAALTGSVQSAPRDEANASVLTTLELAAPDPSVTLDAILHDSSNFDSEVLLQHISLSLGDKTPESGIWLVEHILLESGASENEFNVADGSGLSVYNRLSPHAMTSVLAWAAAQEWFETWESHIANSGEDGSLSRRFVAAFFKDRIRAKTGSVFGTDALAGYFTAASGEEYAFAIFINDTALSHREARRVIDSILFDYVGTL